MGIGKRIKEARVNKGLTQEELAKEIGVTKGAIANYELETSHPKEPIMYALIDALNIEPNDLFQDCVTFPVKELTEETKPLQDFSPQRLKEAMGTMSCEELAQKFQGSAKVISLYLCGERKPNRATAHLMAIYLGVNPDWLSGYDTPKYKNLTLAPEDVLSDIEKELIQLSRALNQEGQEELLNYADYLLQNGKYKKSGTPKLGASEG